MNMNELEVFYIRNLGYSSFIWIWENCILVWVLRWHNKHSIQFEKGCLKFFFKCACYAFSDCTFHVVLNETFAQIDGLQCFKDQSAIIVSQKKELILNCLKQIDSHFYTILQRFVSNLHNANLWSSVPACALPLKQDRSKSLVCVVEMLKMCCFMIAPPKDENSECIGCKFDINVSQSQQTSKREGS